MAELLKKQNQLPTIKVSLALETLPSGVTPLVQLEVDRGDRKVAEITLQSEDLNIPSDFDPAYGRYWEPPFAISLRRVQEIRAAVREALADQEVLWLQLAQPIGHLAVLPWEAILEPVVGPIPIVRIPNFALFTPLSVDRIDIAVCLSEPEAKDPFDGAGFLRRFVPSLLAPYPSEPYVHIFTDAQTHAQLVQIPQAELGSDTGRILLHDPARAPEAIRTAAEGSISDPAGNCDNPWLLWIIDEMRDTTAEVVHFVTHGYISGGQSALAVAESPTRNEDRLWSRFIGPNQMAACLTQLGAWGVGFTSPPMNFSAMGLRQFVDDVARLRAGPVIHHDAGRDPQAEELAEAYSGLFMGAAPIFHPSVSMYVHPGLFERAPAETLSFDSFAGSLLSNALGPAELSPDEPAWMTSTRRYLGQSVARLFPEQAQPTSDIQRATGEGAERALKFVNEVLTKLTKTAQ